jgi:hypothetical protein
MNECDQKNEIKEEKEEKELNDLNLIKLLDKSDIMSENWNTIDINEFSEIVSNCEHEHEHENVNKITHQKTIIYDQQSELRQKCHMFGITRLELEPIYWFFFMTSKLGIKSQIVTNFIATNNLNCQLAINDVDNDTIISKRWEIIIEKYNDFYRDVKLLHDKCLDSNGDFLPFYTNYLYGLNNHDEIHKIDKIQKNSNDQNDSNKSESTKILGFHNNTTNNKMNLNSVSYEKFKIIDEEMLNQFHFGDRDYDNDNDNDDDDSDSDSNNFDSDNDDNNEDDSDNENIS